MTSVGTRATALFLVVLATGAACESDAPPVPPAPGPNVLLIVTDDQRVTGWETMPNVRRLFVDEGTTFTSAFATTPVCCPSRASIFTGQYVHNHGVVDNVSAGALDHSTTIQKRLQHAGYTTALYGKFLNLWDVRRPPPQFDSWAVIQDDYPNIYYDFEVNDEGHLAVEESTYSTDYLADKSVEFIEEMESTDEKPWALMVMPFAPHSPAIAAPEYAAAPVPPLEGNPARREQNRSDKARVVRSYGVAEGRVDRYRQKQLRALMSVDELAGRIFEKLSDYGEIDDTLAIFMSDNGYMWGEHGLVSKRWPYDLSIRIPLVVRWRGHFEPGAEDHRLAANIDIAPTIADVLGQSGAAARMDGSSLLRPPRRKYLLLEYARNRLGPPGWNGLLTKDFHYIEWEPGPKGASFKEYYDLRSDPWELDNLLSKGAGPGARELRSIRKRLKRLKRCRADSCRQ